MGCGPPGSNESYGGCGHTDYALITRLLCRVMRRVRREAPALYDKLCETNQLDAWVAMHDRVDRERVNRKRLALAEKRKARAALSKLTPEECRLLGVRDVK